MDIKGLSKVRLGVLTQVLPSGESPFDIAFVKMNCNISMVPLDIEGDYPSSFKHKVRKDVLEKFLTKAIPQTVQASELVYFSFDPILNVDYCFEIFPNTKRVNLFIFSTSGREICSFTPFNPNTDERVEIERLLKSWNEHPNTFSTLKEKFSKLLGSKKSESIHSIPLKEPIDINVGDSKNQSKTIESATAPKYQEKASSYIDDVLSRLDSPKFQEMRASGMGGGAISTTLSMFTSQMSSNYHEWNGLFDFGTENGDVRVICKKGFEDKITQMAIPYLWKRRSFIENCILFGVEKIVFIDPINRNFDLLDVSTINPNMFKEE